MRTGDDNDGARARFLRAAVTIAVLLTLLRSIVFVVFEGSNFDSDQAVFGIMAKHLAELRAFPLYGYNQDYMLAVSVWFAAPFVALLGPTVTALKLPILIINLLVAGMLVQRLSADMGLSPRAALGASLPFVMPSVGVAALLTRHAGGNVEPFLYVLLLWLLRRRPLLLGAVAGIGFLQREFVAYGIVGLLIVGLWRGDWPGRRGLRHWILAGLAFAAVVVTVELLRPLSTYPGTRTGVSWDAVFAAPQRLQALLEQNLLVLYGLFPMPLSGLNVASALPAGPLRPAVAVVVPLLALWPTVRLVRWAWHARSRAREIGFAVYLVLVGLQSLAAYVLLARGAGALNYTRYILLALLVPIGVLALVARLEPTRWPRRLAFLAVVLWAAVNLADHVRLGHEYAFHRPRYPHRELADYLVDHGVRYGAARYWVASHVTYLSGERVKLYARGFTRVLEYRRLFRSHLDEAVEIVGPQRTTQGVRVASWRVVGPPARYHRRDLLGPGRGRGGTLPPSAQTSRPE